MTRNYIFAYIVQIACVIFNPNIHDNGGGRVFRGSENIERAGRVRYGTRKVQRAGCLRYQTCRKGRESEVPRRLRGQCVCSTRHIEWAGRPRYQKGLRGQGVRGTRKVWEGRSSAVPERLRGQDLRGTGETEKHCRIRRHSVVPEHRGKFTFSSRRVA
jgi:hypothetical protein